MGCARVSMPGGGRGWICGRGSGAVKPCDFCGELATLLCDGRHATKPRTCDAKLCAACSVIPADLDGDDQDFHWCPTCAAGPRPIRGISGHQPWFHAIVTPSPNRKPPPRWMVGGYLALHASLKLDRYAFGQLRRAGVRCPPPEALVRGAVLGVARVTGWVGPADAPARPWHFPDRWGWLLDSVVTFREPIPATGFQGLWNLDVRDPELPDAVRRAWREAA